MIIWLIGLSGAGKTVIGKALQKIIKEKTNNVFLFIDGDILREINSNDLGYTIEDRKKNADRMCHLCKYLNDSGINVISAFLSIFPESRNWIRNNTKEYFEVYIDTSLNVLIKRDSKELYKKALKGEIKNIVGIDLDFTPPEAPDLIINNDGNQSIEECAERIFNRIYLKK